MNPVTPGGVACGNMTCATACCLAASGGDYCAASGVACNQGDAELDCDGPEDCTGGMGCCEANGTSSCLVGPIFCAAGAGSYMCHSTADCPAGNVCCPSTISPYGLCATKC
jgi:hypothetical protein